MRIGQYQKAKAPKKLQKDANAIMVAETRATLAVKRALADENLSEAKEQS